MNKIIYQVDFDQIETPDCLLCDTRIVNEEYPDDKGGSKFVTSIDEDLSLGVLSVIVHYDDGSEDIYFRILRILKS
jgi:hypothetical protein